MQSSPQEMPTTTSPESPSSGESASATVTRPRNEYKENFKARLQDLLPRVSLPVESGSRAAFIVGMSAYYDKPQPWPWLPQYPENPFKTERAVDDFVAGYCLARSLGFSNEEIA